MAAKITIEFDSVPDSAILALIGQLSGEWPSAVTEEPKKRTATRKKAEPTPEPATVSGALDIGDKPSPVEVKTEPTPEPGPSEDDDPIDADLTKEVVEKASAVIRAGHPDEVRSALDAVGAAKVSSMATKGQVRKFLALIESLTP